MINALLSADADAVVGAEFGRPGGDRTAQGNGYRHRPQVSRMAADLDQMVDEFRHRPLDEAEPLTFVAADALTMKVREGGRVVNAVVLVATGVNADGRREALGIRVATSETGPAWNTFFADLAARGRGGVRLVTSETPAGLKDSIAANLAGAA